MNVPHIVAVLWCLSFMFGLLAACDRAKPAEAAGGDPWACEECDSGKCNRYACALSRCVLACAGTHVGDDDKCVTCVDSMCRQ
jgi:hypothetical protein